MSLIIDSREDSLASAEYSASLGFLLNHLVLRYLAHYFAICLLKSRIDDHALNYFSVEIPTIVIEYAGEDFNQRLLNGVDAGCQAFIATEHTAGPFFDSFLSVHDGAVQRSMEKRLIILLQPNSSVFRTISETFVVEEIPDILLFLPAVSGNREELHVELHTIDIYDGAPITIVPRLIEKIALANPENHLEPSADPAVEHFPDKFANMNGRRLRLGAVPYLPNVHVVDVPLGEGNGRYILPSKPNVSAQIDGTELWLVVLFCEIANCTTEIMLASKWGTVFDNGTKVGLIGAPAEHQVDITFAGLYTWYSSFQYLAFTAVHSRSGCTCIVAKPQIIANWRTPFLSFSGPLWGAVALALLTGAVAVLIMARIRQRILNLTHVVRYTFSDAVLVMIGFFMEQSVPMPNELAASCLLFGTLMFAGFMIGSSYNGGLASTMIVPQYEPCVNNVHELAQAHMPWIGVSVSWIYSILRAYQPDMLTLLKTFREWDEEKIARNAGDRDVAIIVERMEYGHFAFPTMSIESMKGRQMLTDDVYWESVIGMCTKTWPARARFDRMVLDLKAFGILAHWEFIGVIRFLSLQSQQIIRYSRDSVGDECTPLRISNISGALLILAVGLVSSSVVFLGELLWFRYGRRLQQLWPTLKFTD
ncbi:uncharacterized protein LOC118460488 isoform X1 [Anopheles albimanus]|uniref:uncharacterized protein LOC118460488 isoform X1 n=2 Tax=Anopheles albimanus TaxID=7167 RepID=UPI00163FB7E7|nr:uncharacterized protein LOC118460488 isoform X1 [Anopheles albimanus]